MLYHRAAGYRHWTAVQCHELGRVLGFGICNLLHRSLNTLTKGSMAPLYLQIDHSYINSGFISTWSAFNDSKCHRSLNEGGQELTKAGFNAACINPNSVPFARLTPKCCRRVGSRAITPSHTNITCSTACTPLGPAAPTTVHYRTCIQDWNRSQQNPAKSIIIYNIHTKFFLKCSPTVSDTYQDREMIHTPYHH